LCLCPLVVAQTALDTMLCTWAVSQDQRWSVIGLCLFDGLQRLVLVGTHGDACDIYMSISHGDLSQVLLRCRLTASRKLRDRSCLRRLGRLSAGVGIYLGIQYQNVDVQVVCQYVIQSAVSDIVCPAIAADDPDRLAD